MLYENNQFYISLAKNSTHHAYTKHIDVQHHFICKKVEAREIDMVYKLNQDMLTDVLTKLLSCL